ncbi:MAG: LLM class F420-dependent oxidoreductase [Acidimicrobiales bacterium]
MHFGIIFSNTLGFGEPDGAAALARAAEDAGFESLWTVEHVVVPAGYQSEYPYSRDGRMPAGEEFDLPDPLVWLTWVAAHTSRIRLGTGVLVLPQRNPAIVAKEVATLDRLSGGRVTLGVGAGWLAEEFAALGVPFEDRGRRLDAYIEALRSLWTGEATLENEFVRYDRAFSRPTPANGPVPIVIGGHSDAAARRAGRIGDGFFPARGDIAHLTSVMRAAAEEAGRDPDAIEVTHGTGKLMGPGALDEVARLAELGVHRVVIGPPAFDAASIGDALAQYSERVISKA